MLVLFVTKEKNYKREKSYLQQSYELSDTGAKPMHLVFYTGIDLFKPTKLDKKHLALPEEFIPLRHNATSSDRVLIHSHLI